MDLLTGTAVRGPGCKIAPKDHVKQAANVTATTPTVQHQGGAAAAECHSGQLPPNTHTAGHDFATRPLDGDPGAGTLPFAAPTGPASAPTGSGALQSAGWGLIGP